MFFSFVFLRSKTFYLKKLSRVSSSSSSSSSEWANNMDSLDSILLSIPCGNRYVFAGWLTLVYPCVGVHGGDISYEFVLTWPAVLVALTLIVSVMGGKWLYSSCFIGSASRICLRIHLGVVEVLKN